MFGFINTGLEPGVFVQRQRLSAWYVTCTRLKPGVNESDRFP
jgi:hypothetical protein